MSGSPTRSEDNRTMSNTIRPSKVTQEVTYGPVDSIEPKDVEVLVSEDGKSLWVNIDGICWLRAGRIKNLRLEGWTKTMH